MTPAAPEPYTHALFGNLAIRVYPDRRPGNLEIAGIHKALVLMRDGAELVEEGAGFGLPLAQYPDKTLFPGSAMLRIVAGPPTVIVKTYSMDAVSRKSIGGRRISDVIYKPVHGAFSLLYLNLPALRGVFDSIIELRNVAGIRTTFEPAEQRGEVEVAYTLYPDRIDVRAKARLTEGCEELVMLNEQGASTFRQYSDTNNTLVDHKMGAWDAVKGDEATLSSLDLAISFTVEKPSGANLWRGRESVKGRLSWSGLALSFSEFEEVCYRVRLAGSSQIF